MTVYCESSVERRANAHARAHLDETTQNTTVLSSGTQSVSGQGLAKSQRLYGAAAAQPSGPNQRRLSVKLMNKLNKNRYNT